MTPWPVVVAAAAVGWRVQPAGQVVWERKSPAFLTNLVQALVGPVYFVALLTGDWTAPGRAGGGPDRRVSFTEVAS